MRKRVARAGLVLLLLSVLLLVQVAFASSPFAVTPSAVAHANSAPSYQSMLTPLNAAALNASDALLLPVPAPISVAMAGYFRGVNLFGAWQSAWGDPDAFPTTAQLDYYESKGLTTFRAPVLWEHLQPTLLGPLDPAYLSRMDLLVTEATARREHVIFTFINQGLYPARTGHVIGSDAVPVRAFTNVWQQLAIHYRDNSGVWAYDLMNEPYHDTQWTAHAQDAINAIRAVDSAKTIIVMPQGEGSQSYRLQNGFQGYKDPSNNLWYEAHIYFDRDGSGEYAGSYDAEGAYPMVGVDRAWPFVQWCHAHVARCYVGEYGIPGGWASGDTQTTYGRPPNRPRWNTVLDNFLTYLDQNQISGTYWDVGPYGDINSFQPTNTGQDRPQMEILERHLGTWRPGV